jgi:uncharacterized repeat protein (TIGR02543 family)
MKLIFFLLGIGILSLVSCDKDNEVKEDVNAYSIEASCDLNKGKITLSPNEERYSQNQEVAVTAKPNEGYVFSHWESSNVVESIGKSEFVFKITSDVHLEAVFEEIKSVEAFTLIVNCDESKGSVSIVPLKDFYQLGEEVSVSAIPKDGYRFKGWVGDVRTTGDISVVFDKDLELTAEFEKIQETANQLLIEASWVYNIDSKKWDCNLELENIKSNSDSERINDAMVKINDQIVECIIYTYKKEFDELAPGENLTITISHESFEAPHSYTLEVPPFIQLEDFEYSRKGSILSLKWKPLECDGYRVFRQLSGNGVSYITKSNIFAPVDIAIDTDEIWDSNFQTNGITQVTECLLWVTSINRLENLKGIHVDSYLEISGRPSPLLKINK